jgi:hypothetical protein
MALSRIDTTNMIEDVPQSKLDNNINFRNIIINGDMSIAQRATSTSSITGNGYHTIDRFQTINTSLGTWTQSQSTDVPSGQGFAKSLKMDCTTADASPASSDLLQLRTAFEGQNLQYLNFGTSSAKSLTLSFWVKSNKTGTYTMVFFHRDATKQFSKSYTISSANTWEKKTITVVGNTANGIDNDNAKSFDIWFNLGAGSNFTSGSLSSSWEAETEANYAVGQVNLADSTSNEWYITGVQLEAGQTASEFEFLPHDVNKTRCFRYFQDLAPKKNDCRIAIGENVNGTRCDPVFQYVEKRANPSVTFTAANTFSLYNAGTSRDCTSMSSDNFSEICGNLNANVSSGLTPTGGASQFITNGTGSQIFVDAEL